MYQRVAGDCRIIVRCESVEDVYEWSKAGPMIRQSLDSNSAQAIMAITPGDGGAFQYRLDNTGYSYNANDTGFHAPIWLRLTRVANVFTGSVSIDSVNWTDVGNTPINMTDTVYIGLAHTSHVPGILSQSVFSIISISPSGAVINSLDEINENLAVKIFPNPVNDILHVSASLQMQTSLQVEIYDLAGRKLYSAQQNLSAGNSDFSVSTSQFSSGMYYLSISSTTNRIANKFVVAH
jgi:hypothetical protein